MPTGPSLHLANLIWPEVAVLLMTSTLGMETPWDIAGMMNGKHGGQQQSAKAPLPSHGNTAESAGVGHFCLGEADREGGAHLSLLRAGQMWLCWPTKGYFQY